MEEKNSTAVRKFEEALAQAQKQVVALIGEASKEGNWDLVRQFTRWAETLAAIKEEVRASARGIPVVQRQKPTNGRPMKLPYFYVDHGDLILRGPSRTREFYEHRIPKAHYDLVIEKLVKLADAGDDVRPQELQDREEMPTHEPSEVVRLLTQQGVLVKVRRGKYRFKNPSTFLHDAADVWRRLPRSAPHAQRPRQGPADHPTPFVPSGRP